MRTRRVVHLDDERIDAWDIGGRRDQVGAQARVHEGPALYDHFLHERESKSLHRAAFDLPFNALGVDGFPCVGRRGQSDDHDLPRLGVDFYLSQLACPRVGRVGVSLRCFRIDIGCGDPVPAVSLESSATGVGLASQRGEWHRRGRRFTIVDVAVAEHQPLQWSVEQFRRDLAQSCLQVAAGLDHRVPLHVGGTAGRHRTRIGRLLRIRRDDRDVLEPNAKLIRDELTQNRPQPLSQLARAVPERHTAVERNVNLRAGEVRTRKPVSQAIEHRADADPSQLHAITCEPVLKCRSCSPMYSWSLSSVLGRPAASVMT